MLNKPAGWHTVAGRSDQPTVEGWLAAAVPACAELDEAGLVHRLDSPTSGCLLVATNADTRATLRDAMSGRGGPEIGKRYLARCSGGIEERGRFDLYFTRRHRGSRKVTVRASGEQADRGQCVWRVVDRDAERGDLVEVDLLGPGRRHVIRAGLASLGHPLTGDALYGGAGSPLCLHAMSLDVGGCVVVAPLPVWAMS